MTVDATYQPGVVQIRQNGDACAVSGTTIVLESGGGLRIESGATQTVDSGGAITVASGGTLTVASGGTLALAGTLTQTGSINIKVTAGATTAALTGIGLITLSDTGANPGYTMTAPANVGQRCTIANLTHGATTGSKVVTLTAHKLFGGTTAVAGTSVITMTSAIARLTIVCHSTPDWCLESQSGTDVAHS